MHEACQDTETWMHAIIFPWYLERLEEIEDTLWRLSWVYIANYNSPEQFVIGWRPTDLEDASQELKKLWARKSLKIRTAWAFHTPYMNSALPSFEKAVNDTNFSLGHIEVLSNYSGDIAGENIKTELINQINSPVKLTQNISTIQSRFPAPIFIVIWGIASQLKWLLTKNNAEVGEAISVPSDTKT